MRVDAGFLARTFMWRGREPGSIKILVVDDNPADRFACRRVLERRDCTVNEAATPTLALAALDSDAFDGVLSDYNLKAEMDGIDVLAHARRVAPQTLRVLMSGFFRSDTLALARERAAIHAAIEKPDTPAEWAQELARAFVDKPVPSE